MSSTRPPLLPSNREAVDAWLRQRERMSVRSGFYPRVVGVLLAATGFVLLMHSVTLGFACMETRDWPRTTGMMYEATIHNALGPERGFFEPRLTYVYSVGARYEGHKISNADLPVWSRAEAQDFIAKRPAGKVVTVYYDPNDPADAVLLSGLPDTLWRMAVPAFAFLFFGISMLMRAGSPEGP